ncbi:MAG: hypothetical protein CMQ40_03655 [Gammaproteobacteria bacterium]|nr:hypothetical protein [Gammaproteobacteria bacterium]|tara:strand:- start:111 stop:500 length:390 start_codon:yes stop_codon:yes gene_type:complete
MKKNFQIFASINVLGTALKPCGNSPVTGYFRDSFCNTCSQDIGSHTVCVEVSSEFLEYSRSAGNDLSTPVLQNDFPGLKNGDRWCLCAGRWLEAFHQGQAPGIFLENTHLEALKIIPLELLNDYAISIN